MPRHSDDAETRMTIAALTAALVRALEATAPGLSERFTAELENLYASIREYESTPTGAMETIKWTSDFVKVPR